MDKFVVVNSDNFDDQVMTAKAYRELTLMMSTGDWHTHVAKPVELSRGQLRRRNVSVYTVAQLRRDFK